MAARRTRVQPPVRVGDRQPDSIPSTGVPLPESGERVTMPQERSRLNKMAKPNTPVEDASAKSARGRRREWEATPTGARRTSGFSESQGMGVGMRYFINNTGVKPDVGPRSYDRQLPGMADPAAAPRPPKWEELTDAQRSHTAKALQQHGTDVPTMVKDMGAQLDQAHDRAWRHGTTTPYASDFYETGEPRKRIEASAKDLGVPVPVHAMTNAFTSPNTKFSIRRASGETSYPNDEAAVHATRWVQQGGDPEKITNELSTTGSGQKRAQGYVTNIRKAARGVAAHLAGIAPADWRIGVKGEAGKGAFDESPKTGPYANSWSDSHPQFTVGDVHTAGGGGFPHLGVDKPLHDLEGGSKGSRMKSEREKALTTTPFAHSVVDYSMRTAMAQRNLGSVRRSQATQWGEEQLQRGESGLRGAPREHQVYGASANVGEQFHTDSDGQMSLGFTQHARQQNSLEERKAKSEKYQAANRHEVF